MYYNGKYHLFFQQNMTGSYWRNIGWGHTVGLARRIWLSDDGHDLMMAPVEALEQLEENVLINETNLTLSQANKKLSSVSGDMLHIKMTVDISKAQEFGINLKKGGKWDCTTYTYDIAKQTIFGKTENRGDGAPTNSVSGALPIEDGKLVIDLFATGDVVIESLYVATMGSVFD